MAKNVTTIPATRNRFKADPSAAGKSVRWQGTPVNRTPNVPESLVFCQSIRWKSDKALK